MQYQEARNRFIEAWGNLGTSWGINKAMAQIHALLLIATEPLSADEIMDELQMSRGNVNMNLRALIGWGIVKRERKIGERREYFSSTKDIWELARQVSRERRRREIEPLIQALDEVKKVEGDDAKVKEFKKVTGDLAEFSNKIDGALEKFAKSDKNWFLKLLMRL